MDIYKLQYFHSDLVSEARYTYKKQASKYFKLKTPKSYKYYEFRNKDNSTVRFNEYNVHYITHPNTNEGIYNITLYDDNKSYVLVSKNHQKIKLKIKDFVLHYAKTIYLNDIDKNKS